MKSRSEIDAELKEIRAFVPSTIQNTIEEAERRRKRSVVEIVDRYLDCSGIHDSLVALQEVLASWTTSETPGKDYKEEISTEIIHITRFVADIAENERYSKCWVVETLAELPAITKNRDF